MQSTPLSSSQETILSHALAKYPRLAPILANLTQEGAQVLLVGGAVRDLIMGYPIKDLDIEIHNMEMEKLETLLKRHGDVSLVGKSFGVLRVHGLDIDWSLPRKDSAGRKPTVIIDTTMSIKDAFARRDLTINAMGIDLSNNQLIDPFGGLQDIRNKVLRAPVSDFFAQDPLRFYRVMQLISRFEMYPDAELTQICTTIDISAVSRERIEGEFEKMLIKSKRPSLGIRWLATIGRLKEILPELYATMTVPQDPRWHPEGSVFEHTMQALDAAARTHYNGDHEKRLTVLFAALCHDLGKVVATQHKGDRIVSYGHEIQGVPIAKAMLKRITERKELIQTVATLVRHHMSPGVFVTQHAKPSAYKRLASKLAPHTNIQMLADLACADRCGRNAASHEPLAGPCADIALFLERAHAAQVAFEQEQPLVLGRDLLPYVQPGPQIGELVKKAYELQINHDIRDKEFLIKEILKFL